MFRLFLDANINHNKLHETIQTVREKFLPERTVKFDKYKHKCSPWITQGILASIRFKDKLYHKSKKTSRDSPEFEVNKSNLKTYNGILDKLIFSAKRDYYYSEFMKYRNDIKKTWSTINQLLCRENRKKCFPKFMEKEGGMNKGKIKIEEKSEITEEFNNHFVNMGPKLAASIKKTDKNFSMYLSHNITTSFSFSPTSSEDVIKIINGFAPKTSTDCDKLSMKLIKRIAQIISQPLSLIVNQSLSTGIFPNKMKLAKENPL